MSSAQPSFTVDVGVVAAVSAHPLPASDDEPESPAASEPELLLHAETTTANETATSLFMGRSYRVLGTSFDVE